MTLWVRGRGDQEKFTTLSPASAANTSGAPDGAKSKNYTFSDWFTQRVQSSSYEQALPFTFSSAAMLDMVFVMVQV